MVKLLLDRGSKIDAKTKVRPILFIKCNNIQKHVGPELYRVFVFQFPTLVALNFVKQKSRVCCDNTVYLLIFTFLLELNWILCCDLLVEPNLIFNVEQSIYKYICN